jgi:hypothetical protein
MRVCTVMQRDRPAHRGGGKRALVGIRCSSLQGDRLAHAEASGRGRTGDRDGRRPIARVNRRGGRSARPLWIAYGQGHRVFPGGRIGMADCCGCRMSGAVPEVPVIGQRAAIRIAPGASVECREQRQRAGRRIRRERRGRRAIRADDPSPDTKVVRL